MQSLDPYSADAQSVRSHAIHACSSGDGPENVFDGQLGNAAATRAMSQAPASLTMDAVYLQLTLDREYADIVGFAYYIDSSVVVAYGKNISVYLSPAPTFQSGLACATNMVLTNSGTKPNLINCTSTITNARYVTIVKGLSTGSDSIYCYEFQILRAGIVMTGHQHQPQAMSGFCACKWLSVQVQCL